MTRDAPMPAVSSNPHDQDGGNSPDDHVPLPGLPRHLLRRETAAWRSFATFRLETLGVARTSHGRSSENLLLKAGLRFYSFGK